MKAITIDLYLKAEIWYFILLEMMLVLRDTAIDRLTNIPIDEAKAEVTAYAKYFIDVYRSAKGYFDAAAIFLLSTIGIAYLISSIGGM